MAIYNSSEEIITTNGTLCNSTNVSIDTAYNANGDVVFNRASGTPFIIMTYNVGSWYGYGQNVPSQYADDYYKMHSSIFEKYNPDFVGIQEYYSAIGSYSAQDMIMEHDRYFYGVDKISGCAGRAFASKYIISNPTDNLFQNQDGGELRYYLKGYINVNDNRVCVISAHTSYSDIYPYTQCNELLDIIENEEYFIIVGDMNLVVDELDSENYNLLNGVWENKGYKTASGHQFGIQKTFYRSSDGWHGLDQVFTSPNITINQVVVDDTKTNEYASLIGTSRIDHCALIVYATIEESEHGKVMSISASFVQGQNVIYNTATLDSLREYLTVTATYEDSTQKIVYAFSLSGILAVGVSNIKASYHGCTDTFNVVVSQDPAYITAVFTQGTNKYCAYDNINNLKTGLIVTYYSEPGQTGTVLADSEYTLSGTLTIGTSTITVSHNGITTAFDVVVSDVTAFSGGLWYNTTIASTSETSSLARYYTWSNTDQMYAWATGDNSEIKRMNSNQGEFTMYPIAIPSEASRIVINTGSTYSCLCIMRWDTDISDWVIVSPHSWRTNTQIVTLSDYSEYSDALYFCLSCGDGTSSAEKSNWVIGYI